MKIFSFLEYLKPVMDVVLISCSALFVHSDSQADKIIQQEYYTESKNIKPFILKKDSTIYHFKDSIRITDSTKPIFKLDYTFAHGDSIFKSSFYDIDVKYDFGKFTLKDYNFYDKLSIEKTFNKGPDSIGVFIKNENKHLIYDTYVLFYTLKRHIHSKVSNSKDSIK